MEIEKHRDFDLKEYYKSLHLNKNILFLYANRILLQIGIGMLSVFTAVFFYEKFDGSFTKVMLVFALMYGLFVLLIPLTAKLINIVGLKRMIITSVIFLPFSIISLTFWDQSPIYSLIFYIVLSLGYRSLYWTPYHIDFAEFTDKEHRGKQVSILLNISEIVITVTPILAGAIIAVFGYNHMFIVVSIFMFASIVPLFFIKDTKEEYTFGYFEVFKRLFHKENRSLTIAYLGDGIQTSVRIAVWPIFIFVLLDSEYVSIGIITSLSIFVLIILRFIIGNLEERIDRTKLLRFGSFLSTTGWILKVFVETGFQIFVVDTYHKLGRAVNRITFDVTAYDQAADNGHYIDEYTVLKEVALNLGRTIMIISSIFIAAIFGITATFLFAAGATILMSMLHKDVFIQ